MHFETLSYLLSKLLKTLLLLLWKKSRKSFHRCDKPKRARRCQAFWPSHNAFHRENALPGGPIRALGGYHGYSCLLIGRETAGHVQIVGSIQILYIIYLQHFAHYIRQSLRWKCRKNAHIMNCAEVHDRLDRAHWANVILNLATRRGSSALSAGQDNVFSAFFCFFFLYNLHVLSKTVLGGISQHFTQINNFPDSVYCFLCNLMVG